MNRIEPFALWIGHGGDQSRHQAIYEVGIEAVVVLAAEEPPFSGPREQISCRFPLIDGGGNPPERLALAVRTVAALLKAKVPTLVCCGGGMSRAPAVVAAALARVEGGTLAARLEQITAHHPSDVSSALWADLVALDDERPTA